MRTHEFLLAISVATNRYEPFTYFFKAIPLVHDP